MFRYAWADQHLTSKSILYFEKDEHGGKMHFGKDERQTVGNKTCGVLPVLVQLCQRNLSKTMVGNLGI